jgi:hypothetical protein
MNNLSHDILVLPLHVNCMVASFDRVDEPFLYVLAFYSKASLVCLLQFLVIEIVQLMLIAVVDGFFIQ